MRGLNGFHAIITRTRPSKKKIDYNLNKILAWLKPKPKLKNQFLKIFLKQFWKKCSYLLLNSTLYRDKCGDHLRPGGDAGLLIMPWRAVAAEAEWRDPPGPRQTLLPLPNSPAEHWPPLTAALKARRAKRLPVASHLAWRGSDPKLPLRSSPPPPQQN